MYFIRLNVKGKPLLEQFPFMYLYPLPDDGRMNGRNMLQEYNNNNNESTVFGCCVYGGWVANFFPYHASSETQKCKFPAFSKARD